MISGDQKANGAGKRLGKNTRSISTAELANEMLHPCLLRLKDAYDLRTLPSRANPFGKAELLGRLPLSCMCHQTIEQPGNCSRMPRVTPGA